MKRLTLALLLGLATGLVGQQQLRRPRAQGAAAPRTGAPDHARRQQNSAAPNATTSSAGNYNKPQGSRASGNDRPGRMLGRRHRQAPLLPPSSPPPALGRRRTGAAALNLFVSGIPVRPNRYPPTLRALHWAIAVLIPIPPWSRALSSWRASLRPTPPKPPPSPEHAGRRTDPRPDLDPPLHPSAHPASGADALGHRRRRHRPFVHRVFDVLVLAMVGSGIGIAALFRRNPVGGFRAARPVSTTYAQQPLYAIHVVGAHPGGGRGAAHRRHFYPQFILRDGLIGRMALSTGAARTAEAMTSRPSSPADGTDAHTGDHHAILAARRGHRLRRAAPTAFRKPALAGPGARARYERSPALARRQPLLPDPMLSTEWIGYFAASPDHPPPSCPRSGRPGRPGTPRAFRCACGACCSCGVALWRWCTACSLGRGRCRHRCAVTLVSPVPY